MKASQIAANEAREKEYAKADFDLCMHQGSRVTKWEHVLNNEMGVAVYLNIDTMQILSEDTAICEKCDAIFEPHERNCPQCDAIRSLKNFKLYRPMKF
jgi:hypothetical protein